MSAVTTNAKSAEITQSTWSDGVELLSSYGSIDSSTWKLGIISDYSNPLLVSQINDLANNADVSNPFFNTPFLSASVKHIGDRKKQYLFLSETIGGVEALKMFAPVVLTRQGITRRKVLKVWTHLYAPLGVPLIDANDDVTMNALVNCLDKADHKEAVAILLDLIPKQSQFTQKLFISHPLAEKLHRFAYRTRAALKPGFPADYLKTKLSGKRKQRLKKGMKELRALGEVTFSNMDCSDEIMQHFEEFLLLEAKSWKGKRGTSLQALKQTSTFARKAVQNVGKEGDCAIYTLRLDDNAIASLVVFSDNGYHFPWKIAFDETYSRYSPGNNLLAHINQELYARDDFKGMDSLAAEKNETANTFWPDELELYSMVIGIGKNAEIDSTFLARETYLKKRFKNFAKEILDRIIARL